MTSSFIPGQKQQRARQQLSCTACRAGKLKCNRRSPCDQCEKRSKGDACYYLTAPPKKKQNRNTKDRIAQLEGLVVQLMSRDEPNDASFVTPPISEDEQVLKLTNHNHREHLPGSSIQDSPRSDESSDNVSQDLTYLKISHGGHSTYRGGSHWEAILDSV
jgi:hypothetical protein